MANSQKHTNKFSKISVLKTDGLAMELRSAHSPKDTEKSKVHKGSEDELSHFKKKKKNLAFIWILPVCSAYQSNKENGY